MNVHKVAETLNVRTSGTEPVAILTPIGPDILLDDARVDLIVEWRNANLDAFPSRGIVNREGTRRWLEGAVVSNPDKILFFIEALVPGGRIPFGHMGLCSFEWDAPRRCEAFHIVRGRADILPHSGVMTYALTALCEWARTSLGMRRIHLSVVPQNERALQLYARCGFERIGNVLLLNGRSFLHMEKTL